MAIAQAPRVDRGPEQDPHAHDVSKRFGPGWFLDHPWVVVGVIGMALFAWWVYGTRTQPHEVRAVFSQATNLYSGLDVRVDGIDAGKIKKVENIDGQAVVTLGIDDDEVWPLHQGTTAALRFGSTIGNGTRIIDVHPGPAQAPEIPDGGVIPNQMTTEATEFDQFFDTFDSSTRKSLQGMLASTGDTFGPRSKELGESVQTTGPALEAFGGLAADAARDEPALRAFVVNTNRVTRTLADRRADLAGLIQNAATTFSEFASNTPSIEGALDRFAPAMREARTTLARLDTSVGVMDGFFKDMKPGAAELAPLARDLRPALADLRATVPAAVSTFRATRQVAPDITRFLTRSQPFAKGATPMFSSLAPKLGCIRPYAPELAGLVTEWASFSRNYDSNGHYARVWGNSGPTVISQSAPSFVTSDTVGPVGTAYALIRPPGYVAGKPWFIPECGYTEAGLDATKDPSDP